MTRLRLTCDFTFNKKEKRKTFQLQCWGAFTLKETVLSLLFVSPPPLVFLLKKKNGHCSFKKLNCPLGPAERRDWWARRFPLETSWKREPLPRCVWELSLCLASIQKSSGGLSTARLGSARQSCANRGGWTARFEWDICSFREKQWLRLPADIVRSFFIDSLLLGYGAC